MVALKPFPANDYSGQSILMPPKITEDEKQAFFRVLKKNYVRVLIVAC